MIDHRQAIELAATAIDFPLEDGDREQLDGHLRACTSCRAEALSLRTDAAALAALDAITPPLWVGRTIGRRHGPRRTILLIAAAFVLVATAGVALAVGATVQRELATRVSPTSRPSPVTTSQPAASPSATTSNAPSATPSPGPMPVAKPTSLPAGSGSAWIGQGPDGGVWVLADHPAGADDTGGAGVLALIDRSGVPRPGWPVVLAGWHCGADAAPHTLAVATDGSIRLVCAEDPAPDGRQRHVAFAFDAAGRALPGWPVELPAAELDLAPVVVGDELRMLAREIASTEGSASTAQAAAWWLVSVSAAGEVRVGQRYEVADAAGSFQVRLASDGVAYRLATTDGADTVTTEITAIDLDGVRPGWPVVIDGITSMPVVRPDGALVVVRLTKPGLTAQTMSIAPTGGDAVVSSGILPIDPLADRSGAGSILLAPAVGAEGSLYVIGTDGKARPAVVRIASASTAMHPILLSKPLQPRGMCDSQDTGCGAWRALPVAGGNGTLYLPQSAVGDGGGLSSSSGGALVAYRPDGTSPTGWPVELPDPMAGFWSVIPRSDGSVVGLQVIPVGNGDQWSLVLLGRDGTTVASTLLIDP